MMCLDHMLQVAHQHPFHSICLNILLLILLFRLLSCIFLGGNMLKVVAKHYVHLNCPDKKQKCICFFLIFFPKIQDRQGLLFHLILANILRKILWPFHPILKHILFLPLYVINLFLQFLKYEVTKSWLYIIFFQPSFHSSWPRKITNYLFFLSGRKQRLNNNTIVLINFSLLLYMAHWVYVIVNLLLPLQWDVDLAHLSIF